MCRTRSLCNDEKRQVSVYGDKNLLFQLQGALLQTGYAGKNTGGHAVFRTEDAVFSSCDGGFPCNRIEKREETIGEIKMKVKRILFIVLGCIGLGLGAVGAVLPLLPSFPFLLLAAFSFAKSSEKLHRWFIGTKLYKNNLESYVKGKGMTWKTKIRIMITVTILMTIGFVMMSQVPVGRIILACVWAFHILYFVFGVKTIKCTEIVNAQNDLS